MSAIKLEQPVTEMEDGNVEYVELLDVPVYTDSEQDILDETTTATTQQQQHEEITINQDNGVDQEMIAMNDEAPEEQEVEYIEAEEVPFDGDPTQLANGHTIFVHDGKQYMIPNSLHQSGQTIVFTEESEEDTSGVTGGDGVEYQAAEEDDEYVLQTVSDVELGDEATVHPDGDEDVQVQLDQEDDDECYLMYGDETEVPQDQEIGSVPLGRQYAVLKNGKLHITAGQAAADGSDGEDIQEKLQALEDTLSYVDVDMNARAEMQESSELSNLMNDDESVEEITGRNLITGQTISLSGFLEKIKRKDPLESTADLTKYKRRRNNENLFQQQRQEYVLVPPVNKRVVVGKTPDGKRIIGKILQIQKKLPQPAHQCPSPQEQQRTSALKQQQQLERNRPRSVTVVPIPLAEDTRHVEELIIDNTGKILNVEDPTVASSAAGSLARNVLVKKKFVTRAYLDQNIVRTLSGLMDLESIERHLAHKNLIVKHVLKKSVEGKVLPGKHVTYFYGYMQRSETIDCYNNEPRTTWTFVSNHLQEEDDDEEEGEEAAATAAVGHENASGVSRVQSINLSEDASRDSQQVNVSVNADGKITFLSDSEQQQRASIKQEPDQCVFEETVTVNLIVIQDEHGKKRTKVIIPQLAASASANKCQTCGRMFKSEQHLRRHVNQYHTHIGDSENSVTSGGGGGGGRYTCDLCNRTFADMETLFRHSAMHGATNGESTTTSAGSANRYTCNICHKSFNTTGSLRRHVTVHYPSLRPLQCMTCMQRFTDESSLKKHMLLHTGIRPFQCDVCSRTFVHQGDLNFHRKIHDLVKRYRCDVCGKEFNRHSNMVRHAEIHRPHSSDQGPTAASSALGNGPPYTCDTCGCQYNFVSSLTRHIVNNHMGATSGSGSSATSTSGTGYLTLGTADTSTTDQHRTAVDSITSHSDEHSS